MGKILKIKDNVDLKELEKFGFEENEFYPNYVYECRTNKHKYYVFICVNKDNREITGFLGNFEHTKLNENQIKHYCPCIFEKNLVEKVEAK